MHSSILQRIPFHFLMFLAEIQGTHHQLWSILKVIEVQWVHLGGRISGQVCDEHKIYLCRGAIKFLNCHLTFLAQCHKGADDV
jgi:hypothetical protein